MKKLFLTTILILILLPSIVSAKQLWEFGSFKERKLKWQEISKEKYQGNYQQNIKLLNYYQSLGRAASSQSAMSMLGDITMNSKNIYDIGNASSTNFYIKNGDFRLYNGSNKYGQLAASSTASTDNIFYLPGNAGVNGEVLTSNGSDDLIWTATSSLGIIAGVKRDTYSYLNYNKLLEPTGTTYLTAYTSSTTPAMGVNDKLAITINSNCSGNCSGGNFGSRLSIGDWTTTTTAAYVVANNANLLWRAEVINRNSASSNYITIMAFNSITNTLVYSSFAGSTALNTANGLHIEIAGYSSTQNGNYQNVDYFEAIIYKP